MTSLKYMQRLSSSWLVDHGSWVIMGLLGAVLVLSLLLFWVSGRSARRMRAQKKLGERGEHAAVQILKHAGYRIVTTQALGSYVLVVDGKEQNVHLRADFVVTRTGRRFVAEAKAGAIAAQPSLRATRRQLLEYLYAFEVDGVLLVDVDQRNVRSVEFPLRRSR